MSRRIRKYELTGKTTTFSMSMGRVSHVDVETVPSKSSPNDTISIWVEEYTDSPKHDRTFLIYQTGDTIAPYANHIGSVAVFAGRIVVHIYELLTP